MQDNSGSEAENTSNIESLTLSGISVFPNPAQDYLTVNIVEGNFQSEVTLSIYNLQGKMIPYSNVTFAKGSNEAKLDVSSLEKGMYILLVKADGNKYLTKFYIK